MMNNLFLKLDERHIPAETHHRLSLKFPFCFSSIQIMWKDLQFNIIDFLKSLVVVGLQERFKPDREPGLSDNLL